MGGLSRQSYDPATNILHVSHPSPVALDSEEAITAYYDDIVRYWRMCCGGHKAYYLVDWNGFSTKMQQNRAYAEGVRRVAEECAITIVRYGSDPLQRSAGHLAALKLHRPSNIYESREEAMRVIEKLRAGELDLDRPGR